MTRDIIEKLRAELEAGITTEVQAVYLLAGIRKIIERDGLRDEYPMLKFHCDWALHPRMDQRPAREMLKLFDDAHVDLRNGIELHDLPAEAKRGVYRITKMEDFEGDLERFLAWKELPGLRALRADGWVHFLRLYSKVVEDIPLFASEADRVRVARPTIGPIEHVASVTVHLDDGRETIKEAGFEEFVYRMRWVIEDKNGQSGEISIYNTFTVREPDFDH